MERRRVGLKEARRGGAPSPNRGSCCGRKSHAGAPGRDGGFTLFELSASVAILVVGLLALAGVMVSVSHKREALSARTAVVQRMRGLLDEIRAADPSAVAATYDGRTYTVTGVSGANPDGTAITVTVDDSNSKLLQVVLSAAWWVGTTTENFRMETQIYNP